MAQSPISLFTFKSSKRDSLTSRSLIMSMRKPNNNDKNTNGLANGKQIRAPAGYVSLIDFFRDTDDLRPKHLLEISYSISEIIKDTHQRSYALGGINFESIFVSNQLNSPRLMVYIPDLSEYKVNESDDECDDYAFDMEDFGNLVRRMLRMYHLKTNSSTIEGERESNANRQHLD